MKLQGFVGKGSGKLGASVWTVRKGVQVVREYTDKVSNPNTRPQVEQRAKFKMLSQLAAVVTNAGMYFSNVSAGATMRNEFVKRNMLAVEILAGSDVATLKTGEVQLTDGTFMIETPEFDKTNKNVNISLAGEELASVAGANVTVITQPEAGRILGYSTKVLREEGAEGISVDILVPTSLVNKTAVLVWVYRFRDARARAKYENTVAADANNIRLTFDRMVEAGDIEVSSTVMAASNQA